jgi:predicted GIY-YIG superfamily endonuclease
MNINESWSQVSRLDTTSIASFISKSFEDVRNAIDCEKRIKSWTRAKRVALVEAKNPKWDDLNREWDQPQTFRFVS